METYFPKRKIPSIRRLGWLFIVPYLYRVHHSVCHLEHDRNYGAVLSIWDRFFGTLVELKPAAEGLSHAPHDFFGLIKLGFMREVKPQVQLLSPKVVRRN